MSDCKDIVVVCIALSFMGSTTLFVVPSLGALCERSMYVYKVLRDTRYITKDQRLRSEQLIQ